MIGGTFGSFPRGAFAGKVKPRLGVKPKSNLKGKRTKGPALGVIKKAGIQRKPSSPRPIKSAGIPRTLPEESLEGRPGIAVVGQFTQWPWGQHPDEDYLATAIERLGIPVHRIDQNTSRNPIMSCGHVIFTGQAKSWGLLHKWARTHKTIVWTLDWIPDFPERKGLIQAARQATYFVSSDRYDWKARYGLGNHLYLPGACEANQVNFRPWPNLSCAFLGSLYSERRKKIARIVRGLGGVVLDNPSQWVYGQGLVDYVQATKVIVGDNYRNDVPGYWSTRNYVIPGAGGFLLTANVPGLNADFEVGKHIAVYDGISVLRDAIRACVAADSEREAIRRQGFDHVRTNHTWTARARTLLKMLNIEVKA